MLVSLSEEHTLCTLFGVKVCLYGKLMGMPDMRSSAIPEVFARVIQASVDEAL